MERRVINPWQWSVDMGFQQAVETADAKRTLYCSGQTSADATGQLRDPGNMSAQLLASWENLVVVLEAGGYEPRDIVRLTLYVTDVKAFLDGAFTPLAQRLRAADVETSMTLIGVDALGFNGQVCEIEATAAR